MKIVFLTSSLNMGGAERVATILSNAWSERGIEVTLITTFSQANHCFYEVSPAVELIYLSSLVQAGKKSLFNYCKRLFVLRRLIQQKKPDVIISFLSNVNVAAILASRFLKIPVICSERRNPQQSIGFLWEWLCKKTYPFADSLVVQTKAVIPVIQRLHPHVQQIYSIANPLSDDMFNIKKKYIDRPRKILLSLGRLVCEKQVDKTILVFSKLANVHTDWDLYIYGDGPMKEQLLHMIQTFNLQNRVFLKGALNNPWPTLVHEVDIFIMTSKYEGFPNAFLEAMAVGLPCVGFDCPYGVREASDNARNAFLSPPDDLTNLEIKLGELMADEQLRITLGSQSRDYVQENYNSKTILSYWDTVFIDLGIKPSHQYY